MKRHYSILLFTLITVGSYAQQTCTFEEFDLEVENFINDAGLDGSFGCDNISLPNSYNSEWQSYTGWAISSMTDVTTPGFTNQFSAITGSGQNSGSYGVPYLPGELILRFDETSTVQTMAITNSTYAYLSMQDGDNFAKKFGGLTGDDPDFFKLTIKSYLAGVLGSNEVVVDLADYTFEDNSQDYILNEWLEVDLSSLGASDSLSFALSSSDTGEFGINTPTYFCVDNIVSSPLDSGIDETSLFSSSVYPNPFTENLTIELKQNATVHVSDINGKLIEVLELVSGMHTYESDQLEKGVYIVSIKTVHGIETKRMIKR